MVTDSKIDRSEYQKVDDDCCPECGGEVDDVAFDANDDASFVEINVSVAAPDMQSAFYECYSATWLIVCCNCGAKFSAEYSNY